MPFPANLIPIKMITVFLLIFIFAWTHIQIFPLYFGSWLPSLIKLDISKLGW